MFQAFPDNVWKRTSKEVEKNKMALMEECIQEQKASIEHLTQRCELLQQLNEHLLLKVEDLEQTSFETHAKYTRSFALLIATTLEIVLCLSGKFGPTKGGSVETQGLRFNRGLGRLGSRSLSLS